MLLGAKNAFLVAFALVLLVIVWSPRSKYVPSAKDIFRYPSVVSDEGEQDPAAADLTHDKGAAAHDAALLSTTHTGVHEQTFHPASALSTVPSSSTSPSSSSSSTSTPILIHAATIETAPGTAFTGVPDVIPDFEDIEASFTGDKWFFQDDVQFPAPKIDVRNLQRFAPHNYQGPGHETFATYLATRNGSIHDPYFCAAQQLIFRLLWEPKIKSRKYPITVFVAPFVDETQREILAAAGALVREIDLVAWHPADITLPMRWRDQFSKLNFWSHTEFSRIAYLDTDAFPLHNIDELMDLVPEQTCDVELISEDDEQYADELCEYAFGAYEQENNMINGGVLVLKPNMAMHAKLLRGMEAGNFDAAAVEQGLLSKVFAKDGPFPVTWLERKWNGFFSKTEDEGRFMIMHEKLWALTFQAQDLPWAANYFNETWFDMLALYETQKFVELREEDGLSLYS